MKQPQGLLRKLANFTSQDMESELEEIEHLLEGAIAEVKPRRDFQKGLGERLAHQADNHTIEIENKFRQQYIPQNARQTVDIPLLAAGLLGGLALILMGVRLLLYIQGRRRMLSSGG